MIFAKIRPFLGHALTFISLFSPWSCQGTAQTEVPYPGTTTIFVPYENAATNTDLSDSPRINLGFNGSGTYTPFIMDTGSVGIVASSDLFTPAPDAQNLGPGTQYYSSSGIIENGTWWTATQEIYDTTGKLVATANVPVLQVTSVTCAEGARGCTATSHPTGISVMGIGFARESPQQPRGTPPYNAFLNLQSILQNSALAPLPADWCNGYVVTPTGVYLGLTSANTANAGFVKLQPWPQYSTPQLREWTAAPMTISVNGATGPGNILMDTGVDLAFLTPPANATIGPLVSCPGSSLVQCAPSGTEVAVYLPNSQNPVAYYTFTVGVGGNLMEPNGVNVVSDSSKTFFNTSRHVLGGINFLYDNTNGYIGYIWNGNSDSSVGFANPPVVSSKIKLKVSHHHAEEGTQLTFTAKVKGVHSYQVPTGGVTFTLGDDIEYIPLSPNGHAVYSTNALTPGKHTVVAKYSGDATYIRSTSNSVTVKIEESSD